jgi:hypothetical protein
MAIQLLKLIPFRKIAANCLTMPMFLPGLKGVGDLQALKHGEFILFESSQALFSGFPGGGHTQYRR